MASQSTRQGVSKLCPRCGAFYQDLTSKTCPQCFAKLDLLDDADAASLIAEQERRASDPDILQARSVEDEKFKEQAFGACVSVVFIGLITLIVCAVIVVIATHRFRPRIQLSTNKATQTYINAASIVESDTIMPKQINGSNRTLLDSSLVLPGSLTHVVHAVYSNGVQVYAVSNVDLTDEQDSAFRLAVSFAAKQHTPELTSLDMPTRAMHYIILAPDSGIAGKAAAELSR
jgi:hypothetical protein